MIRRLSKFLFHLFPYRRSLNLLALNSMLFVSEHRCAVNVNNFVASGNLNVLFLEEFEYLQRSMILLRQLLHYLYQICVLGIGGALTLTIWPYHRT